MRPEEILGQAELAERRGEDGHAASRDTLSGYDSTDEHNSILVLTKNTGARQSPIHSIERLHESMPSTLL